ncbi:DUF1376 domain-containing protein [Luteimonas arsenica]|uniref:DUF1376 domain-containing protein n=1 Tax=Luteimonas arsenica TaxID=1586242 RepID=UPI001055ECF1|nr:DUF1376 domain-containing protein [Luteimonas arsenica]
MPAPGKKENPAGGEPMGFVDTQAGGGVQVNDGATEQVAVAVVSELPAPPYPATTKAGGFRFELDIERVCQSDSWAIAEPRQRPFMVMVWIVSWTQLPAGSLPDNDAVIAARIGMPLPEFKASRDVLMRGWWKANDGRLYHPVITEQVFDMTKRKIRKAKNQADYRERQRLKDAGDDEETGDAMVTDPEVTGYSPVSDCTTTNTTNTTKEQEHLSGAEAPRCRNGHQDEVHQSKQDVAVTTPAAGTGISILLKDGSEHVITNAEVREWEEAYPSKDVLAELKQMRQWCRVNPTKRKTRQGIGKFINGWLARPALASSPRGSRPKPSAHTGFDHIDYQKDADEWNTKS